MLTIETTECSRCGGTGRFGPKVVYNGICFKCNGSGKQYTRSGAKVRAMYDEARLEPVTNFNVGDQITELGVTMKGDVYYFTTTIESIESFDTGYRVTYRDPMIKDAPCTRETMLDGKLTRYLTRAAQQSLLESFAPRVGLLRDGEPTKARRASAKSDEELRAARQARAAARRAAVPASPKQIAYVKALADRAGVTGDFDSLKAVDVDRLLNSLR